MKNMRWLGQFLLGLLIIIAGIFMLARIEVFKEALVIILGVLAVVTGIISLVSLNKYSFGRYTRTATIIKGILGIVVGILAIVMPLTTGETVWTIIMYILGADLLYAAVVLLTSAASMRSSGIFIAPLVYEGVISLVFAIILFLFPQSIANLLVTIFGIIVLAVGVTITILGWHARKALPLEIEDKEV